MDHPTQEVLAQFPAHPTSKTTSGSHRAAGSDASRAPRNAARTQLGRTAQRSHGASRTTLGGRHHHPCAGALSIPCHHRHAWRSLDCTSSLLSSPDLTVTCAPGLTSALLITTDVSDCLDSENHHKGLLYPKLCIPYTLQAGRSKKPFQLAWGKDVLQHLTALQGHTSPGKRLRTSHHPTCPLHRSPLTSHHRHVSPKHTHWGEICTLCRFDSPPQPCVQTQEAVP